MRMKKIIVAILIMLVILLGAGIEIFNIFWENKKDEKSNKEKVEDLSIAENSNQENTVNTAMAEKTATETTVTSKELEVLSNASEPIYKKSEKDIKIPIIIYHAFSTPEPVGDIYKLFSTQERFEENVTTLLNDGYTFITLEELYQYNKGELALPEKVCILTMDDGWLGCYTEAYPVLQKYDVPTTIFIVSNLVGTEGYFSWEQAKEMYDSGLVKLHIHGKSHIDYSTVSKEKLVSDFTEAHEELEEKMGAEIQKIMAYPSGKCTESTKKWLKEAGFEVQVLTKYGTVNKSSTLDLTDLGRIRGERETGTQLLRTIKNASV